MKPSHDAANRSMPSGPGHDPDLAVDASHPVGTALGAIVVAAATGAAAASVAGPVGTIAGAAAGAIVGALAGRAIADAVDPALEESYWRDNYTNRPYFSPTYAYSDYWPAFGLGVSAFRSYPGRPYEEIEPELARDWSTARADSRLDWERAKGATRDAWHRLNDAAAR